MNFALLALLFTFLTSCTWTSYIGLKRQASLFNSDHTAPVISGAADDGTNYFSLTVSPVITWSAATDSESGISHYQIAIGSTAGAADIKTWDSVGNVTSAQVSGLSLVDGTTYYAAVRAVDLAGNISAPISSDGWVAYPLPSTIVSIDDDTAFPSIVNSPTITWDYPGTLVPGALNYEFQIALGTSAGASDILAWTSTGTTESYTGAGLGLNLGVRTYASVRIQNSLGITYSLTQGDGWIPVTQVTAIARYSIAPNWLDYANTVTSTVACAGSETAYYECIHGGEKKRVNYAAAASCANYTVTDHRDVFYWGCDDTGGAGNVFFYSRGIKKYKGLGDLIATDNTWKTQRVVISLSGVPVAASSYLSWWTNTITSLPDSPTVGTPVSLSANTIYTVSGTKMVYGGYDTAAMVQTDKVGIVVFPGSKIVVDSTAINDTHVFSPWQSDYIWLEGEFQNLSSNWVYSFAGQGGASVRFGVVKNAKFSGFTYGLGNEDFLSEVSLYSEIVVTNNMGGGLRVKGWKNMFKDIVSANNGGIGLQFSLSNYHVFQNVVISNNRFEGLYSAFCTDCTLTGLTLLSNHSLGLSLQANTPGTTLLNVVSLNNGTTDLATSNAQGYTIDQLVTSTINLSAVAMKFTGQFIKTSAGNCTVVGGANPGLVNSTCANQGFSNATLLVSAGHADDSFVGAQSTEDSVNTSDSSGINDYSSITDWLNFENPWRAWVKSPAFPSASSSGRCTSGNCTIFDFRLKPTDTKLRNTIDGTNQTAAFVNGAACPAPLHGNVTTTDIRGVARTYLRHAQEILGSGGNNNGLCESNENCLYMPNFGAYQGSGDFWANQCTFTNGTVTGVKMYAYPTN